MYVSIFCKLLFDFAEENCSNFTTTKHFPNVFDTSFPFPLEKFSILVLFNFSFISSLVAVWDRMIYYGFLNF